MSAQLLRDLESSASFDAVLDRIDAVAASNPAQLAVLSQLLQARLPEVEQQRDAFVQRHGKRLCEVFAEVGETQDVELGEARRVLDACSVPFPQADVFKEHARAIKALERQLAAAKKEQRQLEHMRQLDTRYRAALEASKEGTFCRALELLNTLRADTEAETDKDIVALQDIELSGDVSRQYGSIESPARDVWLNKVDITETKLKIASDTALSDAVTAMSMLGTLNHQVKALSAKLEKLFVLPILQGVKCLQVDDKIILGRGEAGLAALELLFGYIADNLPGNALVILQHNLIPLMLNELQRSYLPSQLPIEVQATERIKALTESVRSFERRLAQLGLLSDTDLSDWVERIDQHWLVRKRDTVLAQAREVIMAWSGATEQVEVREDVSGKDLAQTTPAADAEQPKRATEDDADDAWGSSEWEVEDTKPEVAAAGDEEEEDAWGLDEDLPIPTTPGAQPTTMADAITTHPSQKVTLSERYTVSTLPQELLALVDALQNDATRLRQSQSPVHKAHKDFTKIIHLIMLLHRGLVPHLTKLGFPRMLLYNDFSYLATMLIRKDNNLQDTAKSLKRSAESFYKIEIEEKQQQIHLILDSANGFVACTTPTQQLTCTAALQECIDLLSRLQERWESTLSRATLLTALGNLVETAVARFTYEVMSMTDIAEQESAELAKLGDLLSTVERKLFQQDEGGQALAAPYVPSWFRFRYCLEILEANLAYILDLYRDGSLVDFEKRELVEMIQALFADSDKRRMAIAEIQGAKRWQ